VFNFAFYLRHLFSQFQGFKIFHQKSWLAMAEYTEFGNILNLAMVVKNDRDKYVVVAAWLESHDNLIKELLSSPDMSIIPRKRYSTTGRSGSVHFVSDDGGRVFLCITKEKYPSRVAHMCLEEMQDHVLLSPHNSASLVANRPHQLSVCANF
jgi:hypothetical protein